MKLRRVFSWTGSITLALAGCSTPAHSRPRVVAPAAAQAQAKTQAPAHREAVKPEIDNPAPAPAPAAVPEAAPEPVKPAAHVPFATWLKEHAPEGASIVDHEGTLQVFHTSKAGETVDAIAVKYLDIDDIYFSTDLAKAIAKTNQVKGRTDAPVKEGTRLAIPGILTAPYKTGDAARLGWPADGALKGLYLRGQTVGREMFTHILDRMAERGINLVSIDTKDYDGWVTYPSKVALAREAGVIQHPPIRDLPRAIRYAHSKGIRVAMRVSCFEDEAMSKAKPDLAVRAKWNGPYKNGWMDPSNPEAQGYLIDLVKEALDAGADEIQLDYVRYPVLGIKNADFHLQERGLTQVKVITDFVKKVHAVTSAKKVPLALDVFGVIAFGKRVDIDALGQDPPLLAQEVEVLSPMVYPSHYATGFRGWDVPGDHPEIVGIGVKAIEEQIAAAGVKDGAKIRPWLQAMNYKSPTYSPGYLVNEIKASNDNGGAGWMMWNPGQEYGYTWQAVPKH